MKIPTFTKFKIFFVTILITGNLFIPLVHGVNLNCDTNKSQIYEISKAYDNHIGTNESEYYAVIAACSEYKNKRYNLPKHPFPPFPEKKLKYIYNALIESENWYEENIILLLNSNATKKNIKNSLNQMSNIVGPNDIFLFSWNGHGSKVLDVDGDEGFFDPDDYYDEIICPYDIEKIDDSFVNALTDDELDDLFSNISCKGMCLMFESCLSGGLVETVSNDKDMLDLNGDNRIVITSTLPNSLGRANFLTCSSLLSSIAFAFSGFAKDHNNDGYISIEEAYKIARPITFLQSSLFWMGLWGILIIYYKLGLIEKNTISPPSFVINLYKAYPVFFASFAIIRSFLVIQKVVKFLTGNIMVHYPNIHDDYEGELPIIKI